MMGYQGLVWLVSLSCMVQGLRATLEDHIHFSRVFGENRNYRVFLPPDYSVSGKHYPVLYWFHGSGGSSTQETYRKDFEDYVNSHDLIIVNVDGSTESGSTWDYALAFEYETRTQEGRAALTGMHFSRYIRELIGVIDSAYRTIPDRDHRAASGQSMGGLMSPWIASQNKDLIGSASMFSPSPDAAMFGPQGKEVCFVNSELYRSLKGIPIRITIANGDRYRQYYSEQKAKWELTDLTHFEYHTVNYPDHRAVGIPAQFDFHMSEFSKQHSVPQNWHHADPFTNFSIWNYKIDAKRDKGAFTILENVSPEGMLISSRTFLPDGPILKNDFITVKTGPVYSPSKEYILTDFNRSTRKIKTTKLTSDNNGRLEFSINGGGHAIGIKTRYQGAKLFIMPLSGSEERYCEEGQKYGLDFIIVNVGTESSGPVRIKATTPKPLITFENDFITMASLKPGEFIEMKDLFTFIINNSGIKEPESSDFISKISLETTYNNPVKEISEMFIYPVPKTPEVTDISDILILDGTSKAVEVYDNLKHEITVNNLTGGTGNGNSIPEPGETIELYVRLPRGLGQNDINTYHPAYLVNPYEHPEVSIDKLKYNLKGSEWSGAANIQSRIRINENVPPGTVLNLWLKCESYEFSEEGFTRPIQRHSYDYRRVSIRVN